MHTMKRTVCNSDRTGGAKMNEKAYKAMSFAGAANIALGIVIVTAGLATGIIAIVSGVRLLKNKKGLTF